MDTKVGNVPQHFEGKLYGYDDWVSVFAVSLADIYSYRSVLLGVVCICSRHAGKADLGTFIRIILCMIAKVPISAK